VAQAGLLASVLATGETAGAGMLLAVLVTRAGVSYSNEILALRAAASVKSQLRNQLIRHTLRLGPAWLRHEQPGEITTLATRGLDGLDAYFARYLPQLILACIVPVAVLIRVGLADWLSAVVIAATLPLIPLFAILVGLHTKASTQRQWQLLAWLGGHFLDVAEGLPTLKLFGRARPQAEVIGSVTDAHRRAVMASLRVAFLSGFVLEVTAALATALVAVEVGLRLLAGHLSYQTALIVLLLTPEAYLPLRAVGTQFHASTEGAAAAQRVFTIADVPVTDGETGSTGRSEHGVLEFSGVTLRYPGRDQAALAGVDLVIEPGERITLTGASGAGKSSLLALLLRFAVPTAGVITVGGVDLGSLPADGWRARIGWVPQHPHLFDGSVAANIALGSSAASLAEIEAAAELAGAASFVAGLPSGYRTPVGERGLRLSSGQRQQIALARVFLRDAPILLLDEPTAHLDAAAARQLESVIAGMSGKTVIQVTHGSGWGGRVVSLADGMLADPRTLTDGVLADPRSLAGAEL